MKNEKPKVRITPEAAAILEAEAKKPTGTSKVKYASAAIIEKREREKP
jgi:hypothetical protein